MSLLICPTCKQTDQIQKVTSLYASNTKEWKETSTGIDSWGNTTTSEHLRTAHTALGLKLKPPDEPGGPTHPGLWYGIGILVVVILCSILCPVALSLIGVIVPVLGGLVGGSTLLPDIAGMPAWAATILALGLPILCFGILIVLLTVWLGTKTKARFERDMRSYREKKAAFERDELPRWQRAKARWEQLHYCLRDETLFIPGENRTIPVDDMQKHLYDPMTRS
jgi:hypothetical protein